MRLIAKQLEELARLDVPASKNPDFESFWDGALEKVGRHDPALKMTAVADYPLDHVTVRDAVFHGLDGTPVKTWVLLPPSAAGKPVPAIVYFHGGMGSRWRPFQHIQWVMAGFAVIAMDFRQQGGRTGSNTPFDSYGASSFAVMNIENYKSYYLYHAWTDALLSVKLTEMIPEIDPARVVVAGASQGGGTALVMAALNRRIALCLAAVPSFCWWERRISLRSACAQEISHYIQRNPDSAETVFNTLSYFDVMNFADRIQCPVMVSCGLKDEATPPDCVHAAYNKIRSEKSITHYPAGGHVLEPKEAENWLRFVRVRLRQGVDRSSPTCDGAGV